MGRLSGHPHIVSVHRGGTTDAGAPYIVMDLMDGGSLADRLRQEGPLAWPEVLEIGVAVAGALETAHRAGILHLDVKPANVLVSRYGEPKLADFGISRLPGVTATTDGRVRASIAYAAPERLLDGTATPSADLYSLGATLYTLLVGETAFSTKPGEDLLVAISRIVRQPVPDLRLHGVPDPAVRVIERLLAKSPVDRYPRPPTAAAAACRPPSARPAARSPGPWWRASPDRGRRHPDPTAALAGRRALDDEPRARRSGPADPSAVRAAGLGRCGARPRRHRSWSRRIPRGPDPDPVRPRRPASGGRVHRPAHRPRRRPAPTTQVAATATGRPAATGSAAGHASPRGRPGRGVRWCSGSVATGRARRSWRPPASCWRTGPHRHRRRRADQHGGTGTPRRPRPRPTPRRRRAADHRGRRGGRTRTGTAVRHPARRLLPGPQRPRLRDGVRRLQPGLRGGRQRPGRVPHGQLDHRGAAPTHPRDRGPRPAVGCWPR